MMLTEPQMMKASRGVKKITLSASRKVFVGSMKNHDLSFGEPGSLLMCPGKFVTS